MRHARVKDMDLEGIDVNIIRPSGAVPAFCSIEDVALELAMYEAYHRFLAEYCARSPAASRLNNPLKASTRARLRVVAPAQLSGGRFPPRYRAGFSEPGATSKLD